MATTDRRRRGRVALRAAAGGAAALGVSAAAVSAVVTVLARKVVQPTGPERADDVRVLGVGAGSVTLRADVETVAAGRYGVWLDGGRGHARLGEVVDHDPSTATVTRHLDGVDFGRLREGPARWNQYYYAGTPESALGLGYRDVEVVGEPGVLPAWFVPPSERSGDRGVWAILVHGRGATREECLRAVPVLHRLGYPCLVISYRNDLGAATSPRRRYHLGASEWQDVEAAVLHALAEGARDVVLVGWSMGGAIALQLLDRSWTANRVRALVLDAPVLDWRDVLDHHARVHRVPHRLGRMSQALLAHAHGRHLAWLEMPLAFAQLDWVARAAELRTPMLVLHSDDDEFVPSGPSHALAAARPDLVQLVAGRGARHTKEWNVDPQAWESAVARFLLDH